MLWLVDLYVIPVCYFEIWLFYLRMMECKLGARVELHTDNFCFETSVHVRRKDV